MTAAAPHVSVSPYPAGLKNRGNNEESYFKEENEKSVHTLKDWTTENGFQIAMSFGCQRSPSRQHITNATAKNGPNLAKEEPF